MLKDNENAWQFEVFGSERSVEYGGFYAVKKPLFSFDHIVVKGKIDRGVYAKLKARDEHLNLDFPVMNQWEYLNDLITRLRSAVIKRFLPKSFIAAVRRLKYQR